MTHFPEGLLPLTMKDPLIRAFWSAASAAGRRWDDALAVEIIIALALRNEQLTAHVTRLMLEWPGPCLIKADN